MAIERRGREGKVRTRGAGDFSSSGSGEWEERAQVASDILLSDGSGSGTALSPHVTYHIAISPCSEREVRRKRRTTKSIAALIVTSNPHAPRQTNDSCFPCMIDRMMILTKEVAREMIAAAALLWANLRALGKRLLAMGIMNDSVKTTLTTRSTDAHTKIRPKTQF